MSTEGQVRWVFEVPRGPERDVIAEKLCAVAMRMCPDACTGVSLHPLGSARVRMSFPDEESSKPIIASVMLRCSAYGLKIVAEPPASSCAGTAPTSRRSPEC